MSTEESDINKAIWNAAVNGDWETVKQWLEREPSLIEVTGEVFIETLNDDDGEEYDSVSTNLTLLHIAAWNCSTVMVLEYIVSHGVDVNAKDNCGWTPLHYASEYNPNVEIVKYLVSQGAAVNAKNEDSGGTPLHFAALLNSNVEVLKYLVSQGADVNTKDKNGCTPLHGAATNPNVEIVKYLVSQGADIHAKDVWGNKPLYVAHLAHMEESSNFLYGLMSEK